jgi:hypothetical protein
MTTNCQRCNASRTLQILLRLRFDGGCAKETVVRLFFLRVVITLTLVLSWGPTTRVDEPVGDLFLVSR